MVFPTSIFSTNEVIGPTFWMLVIVARSAKDPTYNVESLFGREGTDSYGSIITKDGF